jgi:hypothetical protein
VRVHGILTDVPDELFTPQQLAARRRKPEGRTYGTPEAWKVRALMAGKPMPLVPPKKRAPQPPPLPLPLPLPQQQPQQTVVVQQGFDFVDIVTMFLCFNI